MARQSIIMSQQGSRYNVQSSDPDQTGGGHFNNPSETFNPNSPNAPLSKHDFYSISR